MLIFIDSRPLKDGDIVSIDVSVYFNGVHGDNCTTVAVGTVDDASLDLIAITQVSSSCSD